MHISKLNIRRYSQNKTEKEKQFEISLKMDCIDFEVWPVNRLFCTRGWRPSKRRPPNKIYTICEKLIKTAMWIIPLGSNSAIAFISSCISSLCYLVEGRSYWLVSSELIVDTEVWMQNDLMRHSVTLWSLIFSWTAFSGFQSTGIPLFSLAAFSGFRLAGCTDFSFSSLIFARTLLVRREALIFS